jgi:hypothetical protein
MTAADPILIRYALGRSTDGSQFGMSTQIFADGTVLDSEGVHRLSPADIRPIVELVQSGELSRMKGHCGAPSIDFIDHIQVVVFERRLGRLNASSFSYSGNPQSCDESVRHLHAAFEAIQAKLSHASPVAPTNAVNAPGSSTAPAPDPVGTPIPGSGPAVPSTLDDPTLGGSGVSLPPLAPDPSSAGTSSNNDVIPLSTPG